MYWKQTGSGDCVVCGIYCCDSQVLNLICGFRDCEGLGVERSIVFFCGHWLSVCLRCKWDTLWKADASCTPFAIPAIYYIFDKPVVMSRRNFEASHLPCSSKLTLFSLLFGHPTNLKLVKVSPYEVKYTVYSGLLSHFF